MRTPKRIPCTHCSGTGKQYNIGALKALRIKCGVPGAAMARYLGLTRQWLWQIEAGKGQLNPQQLRFYLKLCELGR